MKEKNFEKKNIKMQISAWPSTSLPNFSHFEELQILGRNFFQNMNEKEFQKLNIKMEISAWSSTSVANFSQFQELQIL